ncbi:excisionase [Anaerobutyricum soehngenii]|uniref:HipA domain-containing protein n=1 Tax=Anaerobutyricum soehngenii TaxID=105843 RepID=UPI001ADD7C7B|nr:excisionase [Anaerobutyricum soehngenii]MBP0058760.1 excisionase [Anaerobutyricum soehngenii]
MSKYILMHKDNPVAALEIDEASGVISAIGEVYAEEHIPLGITVKRGRIERSELNDWWKGRAIPASRSGIKTVLEDLQIATTQRLLEKCLGLSLSDQYWICPQSRNLKWSEINFFENNFSDDMGNILFGKVSSGEMILNDEISLMSPDNTSDGWLKKKWKIINGKRCLIKGGSGAIQQEPYNEVIASKIMERLDIPHVRYSLIMEEEYPYSICEDFITPQTELISAWYVMQTEKKPNHISVYQHYVNCCEKLGIPKIKESLDQMMVVDYLIANEDRHQNNFGVIRDVKKLNFIGSAPLFDSGTSLWFDKPTPMIGRTAKLQCKPFKNTHEEQIKLVSSFEWLDISKLNGIEEEFRELVRASIFIDNIRCDAICKAMKERVNSLKKVIDNSGNKEYYSVADVKGDVKKDISYSGK